LWIHGCTVIARYGGEAQQIGFANLHLNLPESSTIGDVLATLKMPTEERGITFINGDLSAMPGMQPDLNHILKDGDRVAFFHLKAMWPFQYRHGAAMIPEMANAMFSSKDGGLHHTYKEENLEE
jgi:sulfur carrier protein ThiS